MELFSQINLICRNICKDSTTFSSFKQNARHSHMSKNAIIIISAFACRWYCQRIHSMNIAGLSNQKDCYYAQIPHWNEIGIFWQSRAKGNIEIIKRQREFRYSSAQTDEQSIPPVSHDPLLLTCMFRAFGKVVPVPFQWEEIDLGLHILYNARECAN